jgi:amidase
VSTPLDLDEITIEQLQSHLANGEISTRQLVQSYLERIEAIDRSGPTLRSVL